MKTYYKKGDHNVLCDRTGRKVKRSQCVLQWDNLLVLKEHAEERHPQDNLPAGRVSQPVDISRPEGTDTFLSYGDVTPDTL